MRTKKRQTLSVYRTAAKLNQFELAVRSGVPQSVVCQLEQTGAKPHTRWSTVARLARALDVDPFDLFPVEAHRG